MRDIDQIIIHCTATTAGKYYNAKDIDTWHKYRGWKQIGYHYVILLNGEVEIGRKEEVIGAHAIRHNLYSLGVVYIGGLDLNNKPSDTRTFAQKEALITLLKRLKEKYPNAKICGHRDLPNVNKECPCFEATKEYESISDSIS